MAGILELQLRGTTILCVFLLPAFASMAPRPRFIKDVDRMGIAG